MVEAALLQALSWKPGLFFSTHSIPLPKSRKATLFSVRGCDPLLAHSRSLSTHNVPARHHKDGHTLASKRHVPLYVMLPSDTVSMANTIKRVKALRVGLQALKMIGVDGVVMDVWWGIVEGKGPRSYDWSAYKALVKMITKVGLKVQASMCFHGSEGAPDVPCVVSLPSWVMSAGDANPDLFHADTGGHRYRSCLSLAIDSLSLLKGRTPIEVYTDFLESFRQTFVDNLGNNIVEIGMGLGPNGELRYPAHPQAGDGRWSFPGVGEFQCYDKYMLEDLKNHARVVGKPEWGLGGPHDAPFYNNFPNDSGFSHEDHGSWSTPYGEFFLLWYSGLLLKHANSMLARAAFVFRNDQVVIGGKVPIVHWWYQSRSHAAELTVGYYNVEGRNGYDEVAKVFKSNSAMVILPCMEMSDVDQPLEAKSSPESLLLEIRQACANHDVDVAGENSLTRFDETAHMKIKSNVDRLESLNLPRLVAFSFSRMGESLFNQDHWHRFVKFARSLDKDVSWSTINDGSLEEEDTIMIGSEVDNHDASFRMQ